MTIQLHIPFSGKNLQICYPSWYQNCWNSAKIGNLQPINLPKFFNSAKSYNFPTHKYTQIVEDPTHVGCATLYWHFVSWEPEGRYCSSNLSRWEPERRYRCTKSIAIAPFWFSMEHLWTAIMPFWLSTDDWYRGPPPPPHAIFFLLFVHSF